MLDLLLSVPSDTGLLTKVGWWCWTLAGIVAAQSTAKFNMNNLYYKLQRSCPLCKTQKVLEGKRRMLEAYGSLTEQQKGIMLVLRELPPFKAHHGSFLSDPA